MEKMKVLNDGSTVAWMVAHTVYKSPYLITEGNINAGIAIYNNATDQTDGDPEEESALEAERKKVDDTLAEKPKNYGGAEVITARWSALIPAIHAFHQARRNFCNRPLGPDPAAEKQATQLAAAITVAPGSEATAFQAAKLKLDKVISDHDGAQTKSASEQMDKFPAFYPQTKYFAELKQNAASSDRKISADARKQIAACWAVLKDGDQAKATLDTYKSNRSTLTGDAQSILNAILPGSPTAITGAPALEVERQRIASAKVLQAAYDAAERYSKARKAVETLATNAIPPDLQDRHKTATIPPKSVTDFTDRSVLLETLPPLWQQATAYAKALADTEVALGKVTRVEPDASSQAGKELKQKIDKAIASAKQLATQDKYHDAATALNSVASDLANRRQDLVNAVGQRHTEAGVALANHDDMDDSDIKTLLGKLRKALPAKIDVNTDLAAASRDIAPALLLGRLVPAATRYTAALEAAKANWAVLGVPGFANSYKTVTAEIKLPDNPAKIIEANFEAPAQQLEDFNAKWATGKKLQDVTRNLETRLSRLADTRPEGGESYKSKEAAIRRELNQAKLLSGPTKLVESEQALKSVSASITKELDSRVQLAAAELQKLPLPEGSKAMMTGISAVTDKNGRPLGVALYLEFGKDLPKLLAALHKVPDDNDHGKAAKNLAALGQHLGADALQELASDLFDDDPAKLGNMMGGILQTGLAGGAPANDNDKRLENLKSLANAFADTGKLSTLLRGLARGDANKAGERMDAVLTRFFASDPKKLKTPFFDELAKGPGDLTQLIRQAVTFQREDKPGDDDLKVDAGELRGSPVTAERGKHLINRHTRKHCGFTAENVGPLAKSATFWPEGTTNDNVQQYLKNAVAAINSMPTANERGGGYPAYKSKDFVQRDVAIDVNGSTVIVRVGFEFYDPGPQTKITQFYPKSGRGLVTFSPGQLEAIGKAIPK